MPAIPCKFLSENLESSNIGNTFQADHLNPNGEVIDSALDHVYCSQNIKDKKSTNVLENSSPDHLPVITKI